MIRVISAAIILASIGWFAFGQTLQPSGGTSAGSGFSGGAANCILYNQGSLIGCDANLTESGGTVTAAVGITAGGTVLNTTGLLGTSITGTGYLGGGTPPATAGSCVIGTFVGGSSVGTFVAQGCGPPATAATAMVLLIPFNAPHGWACDTADRTSNVAAASVPTVQALTQNGSTVSAVSFRASTLTNDVIQFKCMGY